MTHAIRKVVVLGANGRMGAGAGALFSSAGIHTVLLARNQSKAADGRKRAEELLRGIPMRPMAVGSYGGDLAREATDADLIIEALAEDYTIKHDMFAILDRVRPAHAIVATLSAGLPLASLATGRSDGFRAHLLGLHLSTLPPARPGCELVAHAETDTESLETLRAFLGALGRTVAVRRDSGTHFVKAA